MTLMEAKEGEEYIIKDIMTDDEEMEAFYFPWDVTAESRSRWFRA